MYIALVVEIVVHAVATVRAHVPLILHLVVVEDEGRRAIRAICRLCLQDSGFVADVRAS